MKIRWKILIPSLLLPLAVGGLSALLSGGGMRQFDLLNKPLLSPPGWLFPVVWTILYLLMGFCSYLIAASDAEKLQKNAAMRIYLIQLAFNFFWSILFFRFQSYWLSFAWLAGLWVLIIITIDRFSKIRKTAGDLLAPYWLWVTFAGYLNASIALLN